MVQSKSATVEGYLAELAPERRVAIAALRGVIQANLPEGYEESMQFGMIGYVVPLSRYPETANGAPLLYAALASQKRHMAVYLMDVYADPAAASWFTEAYKATGKRMDMGKSCVRFRKLEDLPVAADRRGDRPHAGQRVLCAAGADARPGKVNEQLRHIARRNRPEKLVTPIGQSCSRYVTTTSVVHQNGRTLGERGAVSKVLPEMRRRTTCRYLRQVIAWPQYAAIPEIPKSSGKPRGDTSKACRLPSSLMRKAAIEPRPLSSK